MKKSKKRTQNNPKSSAHPIPQNITSQLLCQVHSFSKEIFPSTLDIAQYRMLPCLSYSDQLIHLTRSCESSKETMKCLIPLALYYLNCNLPFEHLMERIDPVLPTIKSASELFHLLFQNSGSILRAILIHHYSFTNPIPFYYPIIRAYHVKEPIEYTLCHELWYSLTPHNAVISFGIGSAAETPMGKSTLLRLTFELNFAPSNKSCFHAGTIDLRLTKNFFAGERCDLYYTDWAFFDFHGPTNVEMVKLLLSQVDIIIIHVLEKDLLDNASIIQENLRCFNLNDKFVYVFIRDVSSNIKTATTPIEGAYRQIMIPKLNYKNNKNYVIEKLKQVGREIIELSCKIRKFNSDSLVNILRTFNEELHGEILHKTTMIDSITDSIIATRTNNEIKYDFLSYYLTFVKLMEKKYNISSEKDQEKIELWNKECTQCFKKLSSAKICYIINEIFPKIITDKDSVLILWKLTQVLQVLTNELIFRNSLDPEANERYSTEILWREAILSQKYNSFENAQSERRFNDVFSQSLSNHIRTGEPFELIDGDNLVFFSKELKSLLRHFHLKQSKLVQQFNLNNPDNTITEAPIVLSIIGPQSSGKSTLLNYVFGCKFVTSAGRCTRGVYGSLLELDKPINKSKFILVLDTEGIDSGSKEEGPPIHFDRTLILFCLSVSNIVIINLPGELNREMQEHLKICRYSLKQLKIHKTMPRILFVLNQIADPNLETRRSALKILINGLCTEEIGDDFVNLKQLTEEDLFTLPPAFDIVEVDTPGKEIFDKGVIRQNPSLNFAHKCSSLRVSIFKKLQVCKSEVRPSFTSMSEWLEFAGETWRTIIKCQDIVRFNNCDEFQLHKSIKLLVDDLMEEHFYSKKEEIMKIVDEYSIDIRNSTTDSAKDLKDHIDKNTQKLENDIKIRKTKCLLDFKLKTEDMPKSPMIIKENFEKLERLIACERLDYLICLKTHTNEIHNQVKRLERLENFKKTLTNNISGYLSIDENEQNLEFERLWNESFEADDLDECYQEQNLNDFYLKFASEWDLVPFTNLLETYKESKFDFEKVEILLKTKLIDDLTKNTQNFEPHFYPTRKNVLLKNIAPHYLSSRLEYLTESKFYYTHSTEEQESEFFKYFPNHKVLYKREWVPEDCVPLLQSCSGYYSDHNINWEKLSPSKQIVKLVAKLLKQEQNTPKIVEDIIKETRKCINGEITPVTIQQISNAIEKRLEIFNHEISHIGAELTIHALRNIGSFIFSMAFESHYNRMWCAYSDNRQRIRKDKGSFKQYFLDKVEISKIIHSNTQCISHHGYDASVAEKYVRALIDQLHDKVKFETSQTFNGLLRDNKEMFTYESIAKDAECRVSGELDSDNENNLGCYNFVVRYFCSRNKALEEIFKNKWEDFVVNNIREIIDTAVKKQQQNCNFIIEQVTKVLIALNLEDKAMLNSLNCFQPSEIQSPEINSFQLKESPFRAMMLYLSFLMDPNYSTEQIQNNFSNEFDCNGIKMKLISEILLTEGLLECFELHDTFSLLKRTRMFESELVFNLHSFLSHFKRSLNDTKIVFTDNEFREANSSYSTSRNSLGCASQCPCCGKFCDKKYHPRILCSSNTGHQFASMGGKTWGNDKQHSAIFYRCEDYTNDMTVSLPGRLIKWKDSKDTTQYIWDWQRDTATSEVKRETLIKVWNKFGSGILDYHRMFNVVKITYRPYEEKSKTLESGKILRFQICFVIDGTGSMSKDIEKARVSINTLAKSYKTPNKQIQFRIVVYRDHCDEKLIETYPEGDSFIQNEDQIISFLKRVVPEGGGDVPEASLDGLAMSLTANWDNDPKTRRIIIHLFDAPPHGSFPNYRIHNSNSNPDHCCCCSKRCTMDWERDVWDKMKRFEIEYHGVNTGDSRWEDFESTMMRELDYLCKGFTKCGKEEVNDAVMQIFINYH